MSKLFSKIISASLLVLCSGVASAMPITFNINGGGSSFNASGLDLCHGDCTVAFTPSSGLDDVEFQLTDVGDEFTFDFFDIAATGPGGWGGVIVGHIQAILAFDLPDALSATGTGFGAAGWSMFGGAGGIFFGLGGQPEDLALSNGAIASVRFSSGLDHCGGANCTLNQTVQATVSLTRASVPEPGTLGMLGIGLLGLALVRRRAS